MYQYTTTINLPGNGTVNPSGGGWYSPGTQFWVTASPNVGYQFSSFNYGGMAGYPSVQVAMNGPVNLVANFTPFTGQSIVSNPPGAGMTVDGTACPSPCTFYWATGTQHTIGTNTQAVGSGTQLAFSSWSDGGGLSHTITATAGTTFPWDG